MKKIALVVFACLVFGSAADCPAQPIEEDAKNGTQPEMTFTVREHDFGRIAENGGKVSYDYTFTNTGTGPLVIKRVFVTCKCIGITYSKKPIPPGGKGVISVTYNPRRQQGIFYKAIQVHTNTPEELDIIIAKGEVKK